MTRTIHKVYRVVWSKPESVGVEGWRAALAAASKIALDQDCNVEIYDAQSGVRLRTVRA